MHNRLKYTQACIKAFQQTKYTWNDAAIHYLWRTIRATQLVPCCTLKWNDKSGRAEACRENSWKFRNFQIYTLIMTVVVLPIFVARTLHLWKSTQLGETQDMKSVFSAFSVTEYVCICIPYFWALSRPSIPRKFVMCYESTLLAGKQVQGGLKQTLSFRLTMHVQNCFLLSGTITIPVTSLNRKLCNQEKRKGKAFEQAKTWLRGL